jgi:hypothetical protein
MFAGRAQSNANPVTQHHRLSNSSVQQPPKLPGSPFNLEPYGRTHTISLNKFNTNSSIEICRKLRR